MTFFSLCSISGFKRVHGRNIEKTLNPSDATSEQGFNPHDDATFIPGSNPPSLREDALLRAVSGKENQKPDILFTKASFSRLNPKQSQCSKPSPIKQCLWTTKEAHLSRGPLQGINGNSLRHSHLTPLSRVYNFNNESEESDSGDSDYHPISNDSLYTEHLLMSNLHDVVVDTDFQPSFELLANNRCEVNTVPRSNPHLTQPGPSTFDTSSVKSTFERGESSRSKNLLSDFNSVDDFDSSDYLSSGDCEDIDVDLSDNTMPKWSEYLDVGAPDKMSVLKKWTDLDHSFPLLFPRSNPDSHSFHSLPSVLGVIALLLSLLHL
ncbi:hypothetical protein AgCh_008851 [Apium graveolens]